LIYLLLFQAQQEPWYITLLGVVVVFGLWAIFVLPRELRKNRERDEAYCKIKGITYEELLERRNLQRARRIRGSVRKDVLRRDNYSCNWCGAENNLCMDHIWPFSLGGENTYDNLQTLCKNCNATKSDQIIWDDIKKFNVKIPEEFKKNFPKDLFSSDN